MLHAFLEVVWISRSNVGDKAGEETTDKFFSIRSDGIELFEEALRIYGKILKPGHHMTKKIEAVLD